MAWTWMCCRIGRSPNYRSAIELLPFVDLFSIPNRLTGQGERPCLPIMQGGTPASFQ